MDNEQAIYTISAQFWEDILNEKEEALRCFQAMRRQWQQESLELVRIEYRPVSDTYLCRFKKSDSR